MAGRQCSTTPPSDHVAKIPRAFRLADQIKSRFPLANCHWIPGCGMLFHYCSIVTICAGNWIPREFDAFKMTTPIYDANRISLSSILFVSSVYRLPRGTFTILRIGVERCLASPDVLFLRVLRLERRAHSSIESFIIFIRPYHPSIEIEIKVAQRCLENVLPITYHRSRLLIGGGWGKTTPPPPYFASLLARLFVCINFYVILFVCHFKTSINIKKSSV